MGKFGKVLGTVAVFVVAGACMVVCAAEVERRRHLVPADKALSEQKVRQLYRRGQPAVWRGRELDTIGMPIGGIATGQLYLHGDGTLGIWRIFNRHFFSGYGANNYVPYKADMPVDSGFAVAVRQGRSMQVKRLNRDFSNVEFVGEYPIGLVRYRDAKLPVRVEMEAFSPFIPLNAKDSALPATLFHITMENVTGTEIEAGVVGWLENAVCRYTAGDLQALRKSRIVDEKGRRLAVHTIADAPPDPDAPQPREVIVLADFEGPDYGDWKVEGEAFGKAPAKGTLEQQNPVSGFAGQGLVNTFLGGDGPHGMLISPEFEVNRKFINFLVGGGNHVNQTCMNLIVGGKVVRTVTGKANEKLEWAFWNVQEFQGKKALIQIVDRASGGWGHINVDQIELADRPAKAAVGPVDKQEDYGSMTLALAGEAMDSRQVGQVLAAGGAWAERVAAEAETAYPSVERRSAAIGAPMVKLAPGEKKTFTFVLSWFFPNHEHGREYANRFDSAPAVAHYVLDNHERLAGDTRKWCTTFYEDSTLPRWLLFRLHSTVCNLATGTCQWWGNGRFWAWEGVGCCEGTCTHVWNYEHAMARLFPELERTVREMQDFGEGFDENSGLVGFRGNRAYAADGQCGTVLKAYREHLMSADSEFLKRNWPRIRKTLEFSIGRDGNDNGLIEDSQHNTFDINFEGPNTFVGALYLAALRAGEEMAKEMGDEGFAQRCRKIFESGRKLTMERLWNGEYFIQEVDLTKYPKYQYGDGCLSDQVFGQGWAHLVGLGYVYPAEAVKTALGSVWKYNWAPDVGPHNATYAPERWFARPGEPGLLTCTWPKSEHMAEGVRYRDEVWTGIEYQVAGGMIWEGMVDEAMVICDGVQQRYSPARLNPYNEIECGDHYARALASWGVYQALAGYEYHGPRGHLGFAPKVTPRNFKAAFTGAEGWGTFAQTRTQEQQRESLEVRWGRLRLASLAFAVPREWKAAETAVQVGDRKVDASSRVENGRVQIKLAEPVVLGQGDVLEVVIERGQS